MRLSLTLILISILTLGAFFDTEAYSQEEGWDVFSSRFCTVFYEEGVNLKVLNRRINLRFSDFYNPRRFKESSGFTMEEILAEKFDAIFSKVEEILDMRPSKISVTIHVYRDRNGLDAAYEGIFHQPNTAQSFYVYKTNTIYTTERAVNEGILAHEMAHCIIDHYFVILPPRKIQEMLAVYADVHLKD